MFPENSIERIVDAVNKLLTEHEMKLALLDDFEMLRQITFALKPFLPYLSEPLSGGLRGIPIGMNSGVEYCITAEGEVHSKPDYADLYKPESSPQKVVDNVPLPSIVEALAIAFEHKLRQRRMVKESMDQIQKDAKELFGPEGEIKLP